MSKVDFDLYARNYRQLTSAQTGFFDADSEYFTRYKVQRMKAAYGTSVGDILDFGCGVGQSIKHLQNAFPEAHIVGCDPSAASLDIARQENANVRFVRPSELSAGPAFDLILASCVFHHVAPPERLDVLQFCRQRLRPQGQLFVFEHNPYNPVTRYLVSTCPFDEDAVLLSRSELTSLLRRAGFRVTAANYCLFFPKSLSSLRSLEAFIGWLPLGGQHFVAGRPI